MRSHGSCKASGERVAMVALLDAADVAAPIKTWRFAQTAHPELLHGVPPGEIDPIPPIYARR